MVAVLSVGYFVLRPTRRRSSARRLIAASHLQRPSTALPSPSSPQHSIQGTWSSAPRVRDSSRFSCGSSTSSAARQKQQRLTPLASNVGTAGCVPVGLPHYLPARPASQQRIASHIALVHHIIYLRSSSFPSHYRPTRRFALCSTRLVPRRGRDRTTTTARLPRAIPPTLASRLTAAKKRLRRAAPPLPARPRCPPPKAHFRPTSLNGNASRSLLRLAAACCLLTATASWLRCRIYHLARSTAFVAPPPQLRTPITYSHRAWPSARCWLRHTTITTLPTLSSL
jgi:hypothetical protein